MPASYSACWCVLRSPSVMCRAIAGNYARYPVRTLRLAEVAPMPNTISFVGRFTLSRALVFFFYRFPIGREKRNVTDGDALVSVLMGGHR